MFYSLDLLWYIVIGVAMFFYVILDGFDLGVGMLHMLTKKDDDRRVFLNAIGPVWDGNEVWLVIVGGALFAGFPNVYATLFSGFYNLCMLFLAGLIFRAAAIEFRSKHPSRRWRSLWDLTFAASSALIAFGLGVILGNLIEGIPLDVHGNFVGSFDLFFRPYPLLIGAFSCTLLTMHGAIFLAMKTEGILHLRLRRWVNKTIAVFLAMYAITTAATLRYMPHMLARMLEEPFLFVLPFITLLSLLNVPREFSKKRDGLAFCFSCFGILCLLLLFGAGIFPNLVRSSIRPEALSLTFYNSASSPLTLKVLLIIVAIGVPLVLAYGFFIYRTFRGKVKIGPTSY